MNFRRWSLLLLIGFGFGGSAVADTIEFPEEELATETVLPVFEKVRSVLNRNVETAKRIEIGGGVGLALNEPFYNPLNFSGNVTYHLTNQHAFNANAHFFMGGTTDYADQLKRGEGLNAGQSFDPSEAPEPKFMVFGNYQFTAYYGKLSVSKQSVMNLTLFGLAGVGVVQTGGISNLGVNVGFGQNFYFTPQLAARFDLKLVMYNGPDATSRDLLTGGSKPAEGDFDTNWFFKTYLSLGLIYML